MSNCATKFLLLLLVTTSQRFCHGWISTTVTTMPTTVSSSSVLRALASSSSSSSSSSPQGDNDEVPNEVERLKEQASRLREEISLFESERLAAKQEEQRQIEQAEETQRALRERYSTLLPILKADGSIQDEQCYFPPRLEVGSSYITVVEARLPLGVVLGESETVRGSVVVDEVAKGSQGAIAGIRVGDMIRASTACRMQMSRPTWQLMVGGIGQPRTVRFMYGADNRPFEEVLDAILSNRLDPEARPVLLVIERMD